MSNRFTTLRPSPASTPSPPETTTGPLSNNRKRCLERVRRLAKRVTPVTNKRKRLGLRDLKKFHSRTNEQKCNANLTTAMDAEVGAGVEDESSDDDSEWGSDGCYDDIEDRNDGMAAEIWAEEDGLSCFEDTRSSLRMGIAVYYRMALQSPPRDEWGGRSGTIAHICDVFHLKSKKRRMIRRILLGVQWCEKQGFKYNGKDRRQYNPGRVALILPGSKEEHIIADWMEANLGFRNTLLMVNSHRVEEGLMPVGRNAIMTAFDRMNPRVDKIQKVPQGNSSHEGWAEARRNQTKQFLVMLGEIGLEQLEREHPEGIPPGFDPRLLPKLSRNQVVFFDETHIEQEGGLVTTTGYQIRFPRDENGRYCPASGQTPLPVFAALGTKSAFKYAGQSRLCLGVAAVRLHDGSVVGRKSRVFDYTNRRLISLKEWHKRIKEEINRVRSLKTNGKRSKWIDNMDPNNKKEVWQDDSIDKLPGVGKPGTLTHKHLSEAGLTTVREVSAISPDGLAHIRGIRSIHSAAATASPGSRPTCSVIDHRQADNPYESKYGESWDDQIRMSTALAPFRPISDLVKYMMEECAEMMHNTVHQDDWFFYHDALSLLTSKECRIYMKNTHFAGIKAYDKWLLPTKDVNVGTRYHERCVGNSPEFMPLDNSLNYDLQVRHRYHCAVTVHLPTDDPRKHTLATPKRITDGLKKIWENPVGAPNPERVVQDVNRAFDAFMTVYKANGKIVKGLANRNGHRNTKEGSLKWGGKRVKKLNVDEEKWLEEGAKNAYEEKKTYTKSRFVETLEL